MMDNRLEIRWIRSSDVVLPLLQFVGTWNRCWKVQYQQKYANQKIWNLKLNLSMVLFQLKPHTVQFNIFFVHHLQIMDFAQFVPHHIVGLVAAPHSVEIVGLEEGNVAQHAGEG